jgi:hypothetical protein
MTTITLNPSASNHDASQDGTGAVTLTGYLVATAGTHWIGLLLPGVTVPVGATINSATLYYKPYSTTRDDPGFNWYAEASDSAAVFTTTGSSISSRSRTAAVTGDTATNIGTGSYRTVDVTAQVDEVTSRNGWASGNNIALIADATAAADIWILSYDSGSGIWYVEIDYTAGVFTRTVSASGDDGAESTGGSMTLTTTTMDTDSVGDIMGFMFRGVQVPTGSSITTAYLKVYTNDSGRDSPNVTIKAEYNPAAFSTSSSNFSGRTLTTASASWVATDIGIGAYKNSPSLTSVLQEVVDNGGWTGAGDVAFFLIQNSASGWLRVASWDHATDPPPQLYVEWTEAGGDPQTVTLNTLSAAGSAVALTVAPGVATIALDTLSSALSAVSLTVVPGAVELDMATLTAVLALDEIDAYPDPDISITLNTLTGALAAVSLVVAPGEVSQLLDTLSAALGHEVLDVAPGAVGLDLATLSAALEAVALTVTPGAAAVDLSTLSVAGSAVSLTVTPGGAVILLSTLDGTFTVISLSIEGQSSYIALNTLTGAASVVSLTVAPGEYVAALNTLIALSQLMDLTVNQGIVLATLNAALSAVALDVVPGEYVATLATLAPALSAVNLTVAPGAVGIDLNTLNALLTLIAAIDTPDAVDVTIALAPLMAALSVTDLGVIPGDMLIELQTLAGQLSLYDLLIFVMLGYAMHGTRAMSKVTMTDYAPLLIRLGDTEGRD